MNSLVNSINNQSILQFMRGIFMSSKFAKSIQLILLLSILYMLSNFSWVLWEFFLPKKPIVIVSSSVNSSQSSAESTNIAKLTNLNLFGNTQAVTAIETEEFDAPITRLKLKLRGVYASVDNSDASAMIEANNKQDIYKIGNKLPGAAGLKLHQIFSDRVIMSRGNKYETLLIEDFGGSGDSVIKSAPSKVSSNSNSKGRVVDKRKDQKLSNDLSKLRSKLSDPKSLSELISVSPALSDDQFQGFRIAPGKNRALFGRLGLRRNDIVTDINGIKLDDPASAFTLMDQISSASEINLTIRRGNQDVNILLSADQ